MIREFDFNCIQGVRDGMFLYEDDGKIEKIDIKKSTKLWWDKRCKTTIMDVLFRRRAKNRYAGDKCFNFAESYIRMYVGEGEILFKKKFSDELDSIDACEFRTWWDDINISLNQLGYWLFDEG